MYGCCEFWDLGVDLLCMGEDVMVLIVVKVGKFVMVFNCLVWVDGVYYGL